MKNLAKTSFLGIVLSGLIIFADYAKIATPLLDTLDRVVVPIQKIMGNVDRSISQWTNSFTHIGRLKEENVNLREQIAELQSKAGELEKIKEENTYLRSISCIVGQTEEEYLIAEVISLDRDIRGVATLKIDKGEKNGVSNGAVVLAKPGVLLGRISDVRKNASYVEMISSFSSKIAVYVKTSEGNVRGLLSGKRGNFLVVENVTLGKTVHPGDQVVTSGEDDYFPKDLLVGSVDHTDSDPAASFQTIYLNSMFDPDSLKYILVSIK